MSAWERFWAIYLLGFLVCLGLGLFTYFHARTKMRVEGVRRPSLIGAVLVAIAWMPIGIWKVFSAILGLIRPPKQVIKTSRY